MIGVDNYSFHRLLGEVRPGELRPDGPGLDWVATIDAASRLGAQVVALETCFMDRASAVARLSGGPVLPGGARDPASPELMFSWGHPHGLEYGASRSAEEDATAWLVTAAALGHQRMRIVVAHPDLRPANDGWDQVRASVPALRRLAATAAAFKITLAVENHADLTARQLRWLVDEVGSPALAVCFDVGNAVRVGDDPVAAAALLAPVTAAAHVKDISAQPWHPRSGPTSAPLGAGVLPLQQVLAELTADGREPWLLVEIAHLGEAQADELALIAADLSWLRDHAGTPAADPQR